MSVRRFFSEKTAVNKIITIKGDELFHLGKVNRAKAGDRVEVINGRGALYRGVIRKIEKNEAVVDVENEITQPKPALKTVIAPSLIKRKAMNLLVEKLTEIGVDEIRPLLFTRTDEKYGSSMLKKWRRIAEQSLKVNKKLWLTEIFPPVPASAIFAVSAHIETKILLDAAGENAPGGNFDFPVLAVIGPPGDFEAGERELFLENGFTAYRLNDCILKTETAALSIAAILKKHQQSERDGVPRF